MHMAVYYGIIKDHRVVLDDDVQLADGMLVEIRPRFPMSSSEDAFKERLLAEGLLTALPAPQPVSPAQERHLISVKGEPLSQTIIAERR